MRAVPLVTTVILAAAAWPLVAQRAGEPIDRIKASNDVAWLEKIAASPDAARELHRASQFGQFKDLRIAAYARLGAIATTESVAAADRIEKAAEQQSITPALVPTDVWPAVGWHMSDQCVCPVAEARGPGPRTYAVVASYLLGGPDLFVVERGAADTDGSWSRPKLTRVPFHRGMRNARLEWRQPDVLRLVFTQDPPPPRGVMEPTYEPGPVAPHLGQRTVDIDLLELRRDSDGDGWTDIEEERLGLNPHAPDTDGDGLADGADVCPLYASPAGEERDEEAMVLRRAIFAAFGLTGSRTLLNVVPGTKKVHVFGYGGPVIFDRPIPRDGTIGGTYVSWKITDRTETEASVDLTDWEGPLAAGGQTVRLRKLAGRWTVTAVQTTWVS